MGKPYLALIDVVKSYDGTTNVVDCISLAVERGEFVTFLGPSGSGKTTTLMMIAGFEHPTNGRIELDGYDLVRRKPYQRNIGMVFQNYAVFPHMTVLANVLFPLRMRRFAKNEMRARAARMLKLVGLTDFAARHPRELSGGQQQRVALARALVFNPDLLLLDEPLGALDKALREQLQVEIKRIHRELGITMIYVTHDQTEAMTMSDRVAVFRHGRIEQIGSPLEVYRRPATRFVGEFVGDSNFFPGTIDPAAPDRAHLTSIGTVSLASASFHGACRTGAVDIMVRPERLQVLQADSPALPNRFSLTVEAAINYGDSLLLVGRTGQLPVRVRVGGTDFPAAMPGALLTIGWKPSDAHVLPRADGEHAPSQA